MVRSTAQLVPAPTYLVGVLLIELVLNDIVVLHVKLAGQNLYQIGERRLASS
jgi:hypothetical protein